MKQAAGWAVVAAGAQIYVNTISDTRRGAIVNWLVTEKKTMVYTHHTDQDIERMWAHHGQYVDIRQVTISDDPAANSAAR